MSKSKTYDSFIPAGNNKMFMLEGPHDIDDDEEIARKAIDV